MAIPERYRVHVFNDLGATLAANAVKIEAVEMKYNSGVIEYQTKKTIFDNAGTIADQAYDSDSEETATDAEEMDLYLDITTPSGATGSIVIRLQSRVDGSGAWPEDGEGTVIDVIAPGASKTNWNKHVKFRM